MINSFTFIFYSSFFFRFTMAFFIVALPYVSPNWSRMLSAFSRYSSAWFRFPLSLYTISIFPRSFASPCLYPISLWIFNASLKYSSAWFRFPLFLYTIPMHNRRMCYGIVEIWRPNCPCTARIWPKWIQNTCIQWRSKSILQLSIVSLQWK